MSLSRIDDRGLTDQMKEFIIQGGFLECKDMHDGTCLYSAIFRFLQLCSKSYKYYIPIHLIPFLIFKRKKLRENPTKTIATAFYHYLKSVIFVSLYVAICKYVLCKMKNFRGKIDGWNPSIAASTACSALFLEAEGRRQEIALFIFPKCLETAWNLLHKRGLVSAVKGWELLVFGLAMGILNYYYHHDVNIPQYIGTCNQVDLSLSFQEILGAGLIINMIIFIIIHFGLCTQLQQSYLIKSGQYAQMQINLVREFTRDYDYGKLFLNIQFASDSTYDLFYFPTQLSPVYQCYIMNMPYLEKLRDCFRQEIPMDCQKCSKQLGSRIIHSLEGRDSGLSIFCLNCKSLKLENMQKIEIHSYESQPQSPILIIDNSGSLRKRTTEDIIVQLDYELIFDANQSTHTKSVIMGMLFIMIISATALALIILRARYRKMRSTVHVIGNKVEKSKEL